MSEVMRSDSSSEGFDLFASYLTSRHPETRIKRDALADADGEVLTAFPNSEAMAPIELVRLGDSYIFFANGTRVEFAEPGIAPALELADIVLSYRTVQYTSKRQTITVVGDETHRYMRRALRRAGVVTVGEPWDSTQLRRSEVNRSFGVDVKDPIARTAVFEVRPAPPDVALDDNEPGFRDALWRFDPLGLAPIRPEIDDEYDNLGQRLLSDVESGMPVDEFVAKWPQVVALEFHSQRRSHDDPLIATMSDQLRILHAEMLALVIRRPLI